MTTASALLAEIRAALRGLRRRPTTTLAAVVTLGLGIAAAGLGAASLEQMLLRRLPFEDPANLFTIYEMQRGRNWFREVSYPELQSLQRDMADRAQLAGFVRIWAALGDADHPVQVIGELVTSNYFSVLGIEPAIGRFFVGGETGSDLVVLSHGLWQRQFGGTGSVVGRRVRLDQRSFTIIGVAPPGFHGPAWQPEYWLPLEAGRRALWGDDTDLQDRSAHWLQTIGRLTGRAGRGVLARQIVGAVNHPEEDEGSGTWAMEMLPARQLRFFPAYRTAVIRIVGGFEILALLVLVTAAANLSTMMIAQGQARTAEMAVRRALGARRSQLARRIAVEVGCIGVAGALTGLMLMGVASPLVSGLPLTVPVRLGLSFDSVAVALATLAGLGGCLLIGLIVGVVELRGLDFRQAHGPGNTRARVTNTLVAFQVAGSTILLVAMSLLVRSAWNTSNIDLGFRTAGIISASISLDANAYDERAGSEFYARLRNELVRHPLINDAAITSQLPLRFVRSNVEVKPIDSAAQAIDARLAGVSPGLLELLEVPILAGRSIADSDAIDSGRVAVINETLNHRLGGNTVGTEVQLSGESRPRTVVGVVADSKYNALTETAIPFVHVPLQQQYWPEPSILLIGRGVEPLAAMPILRDVLARLDPLVPLEDPTPLTALHDRAGAESRANAAISSTLAAIGLLLAVTGLYGMMAHSLATRRREIAIRSAVGATPGALRREALVTPARPMLVGISLGLLGAYLAAGALATSLVGVQVHELSNFATPAIVIVAASLGVAWFPAGRASRQPPAQVLRAE